MNNLGGYKAVRLFFADQITVSRSAVSTTLSSGVQGLLLPISGGKVSLRSVDRGDGSFSHQVQISLKSSGVDAEMASLLRQISRRGALVIGEDFSGRSWLFGDGDYPLTGSAVEEHGTAYTDLHHWKLELGCVCLHPELMVTGSSFNTIL